MTGWQGKILVADLGSGTFTVERPAPDLLAAFIGGKGLAGRYLRPRASLEWDHPDMPLIFMTGPLVDTPSPASGRMCVMSRSPLTGTVCDASVGGRLAVQIKRAGWDGIIVTGRAQGLVGIELEDGDARFVDAAGLAGATTGETSRVMPQGWAHAVVGPAAERGVRFASIAVDGHFFAGRGGLGLVMGARGLKFIRVRGSGKTPVADPAEMERAREEIFRLAAASPILKGELGISHFGTGALYDLMHARRMMPTDNFRATRFQSAGALNAWAYRQAYSPKKAGCAGCHIQCKMMARDGRPIPEFETMSHFTALVGNEDIDTVMEANRLCNELGMDTITAASTLACRGEIRGERAGSGELLRLLDDMGNARGEGRALALGSRGYAGACGMPDASISVKGLELPAYDPRGAYGMALAYATSTRGACHLRAYPISHEILRKPVATDRFTFSGKARIVKIGEDLNAAVDSLTSCKFMFFAATLEEYARAYAGATGVHATGQDLLRAGERAYYHERLMNARNGFTAADDDLPRRFFECAGSSGDGITVGGISRGAFLAARAAYYRVRGLDRDGMPVREKCEELGLEW